MTMGCNVISEDNSVNAMHNSSRVNLKKLFESRIMQIKSLQLQI